MLMVHPPPRHQRQPHHPPIVDRGRSRDISPVALARRASEERRIAQRRALVHALRVQDPPLLSTDHPEPSSSNKHEGPYSSNINSDSSSTIASCSTSPHTINSGTQRTPNLSSTSYTLLESNCPPLDSSSCSNISTSFVGSGATRSRGCVTNLYSETQDNSDDDPIQPRSLQEQMQEAYAAEDMHRARVLYLKIQGIDITSDDDPRIAQVRDEDFVFVPGGRLELDDESLAVWREAQRRQEAKAEVFRRQGMQSKLHQGKDTQLEVVGRFSKPSTRGNTPNLQYHMLETNTGSRYQPGPSRRNNIFARPCSLIDSFSSPSTSPSSSARQRVGGLSSSLPSNRPKLGRTSTTTVSFKEVMYRMQGALFPEEEPESRCIAQKLSAQDKLLSTLLEDVTGIGRRRRIPADKGKQADSSRNWVADRLVRTSTISSTTCLACSADTSSSISRTNSWASYTSSGSVSTLVTSPPNSPSFEKLSLPPLIDDKNFRQGVVHSCRRYRKSKLTPVPLNESPLLLDDSDGLELHVPSKRTSSQACRRVEGKNAVVARMKQSFSNLLELANRVQLSYIRTLQFSIPLPMEPNLLCTPDSTGAPSEEPEFFTSKPFGYRACASDVQKFMPYLDRKPIRELNFTSETNIPLLDVDVEHPVSRVFSPLAFVPPSPLRPREQLSSPEWRLRPVANPVTLRLKALSNRLYERGIPWEGRAHTGSLGCGRERLTGVAFEGLGGSRLAFEAR